MSDNEALLEMHIDERVVDDFAALIEAQGPRADLLAFLGAICSCKGRGVKSNQELCANRLGLVDSPGRGLSQQMEARRATLLLRCRSGGDLRRRPRSSGAAARRTRRRPSSAAASSRPPSPRPT